MLAEVASRSSKPVTVSNPASSMHSNGTTLNTGGLVRASNVELGFLLLQIE
jgi:hypothetical protein